MSRTTSDKSLDIEIIENLSSPEEESDLNKGLFFYVFFKEF